MRLLAGIAGLTMVGVLAAGCTGPGDLRSSAGTPVATLTPAATSPATSSATAPPAATPVEPVIQDRLVVGIEQLTLVQGGVTTVVRYDDPSGVLGLVTDITGEDPPPVAVPPYNGMDFGLDTSTFAGIRVVVPRERPGHASVAVTSANLAGIPVTTSEGISVGSTRADAVAAGAEGGWDEDQDGVADYLNLGRIEVPEASSLATPGAPGIRFVLLVIPDDVVTQLQAPSDDFSDI